jgi:undecaprenyl-diphosphatase
MSIATGANHYNKVWGRALVILSCLVGISRIYVGHHYPVDVMGGYMAVLAVDYLYAKVLRDRVQHIYLKAEKICLKHMPALKTSI